MLQANLGGNFYGGETFEGTWNVSPFRHGRQTGARSLWDEAGRTV